MNAMEHNGTFWTMKMLYNLIVVGLQIDTHLSKSIYYTLTMYILLFVNWISIKMIGKKEQIIDAQHTTNESQTLCCVKRSQTCKNDILYDSD